MLNQHWVCILNRGGCPRIYSEENWGSSLMFKLISFFYELSFKKSMRVQICYENMSFGMYLISHCYSRLNNSNRLAFLSNVSVVSHVANNADCDINISAKSYGYLLADIMKSRKIL